MPPQENSIDDAIAAVTGKDYQRAMSILTQLNSDATTRSLRSIFMYAQVLEAQGTRAPTEQLADLAGQSDSNPLEEAHFFAEMATLIFRRGSRTSEDFENAGEYLKQALQSGYHPNPKVLLANLCRVYFELGDYKKVAKYAERLYAYPDFRLRAGLSMAHCCLRLHNSEKGKAYLDGALGAVAGIDEADLSWLFDLLILFGKYTDAQALLDKLSGGQYRSTTLSRLQAEVWFAQHQIDDASNILTESFCASDVHDIKTRTKLLFMRGRCLDEAGKYADAFGTFMAMNELSRQIHGISTAPEFSTSYEGIKYTDVPSYPVSDSAPYVPAFMIGFPRSGTTLLETVLDTQDDILTLSETQGISETIRLMRSWGVAYPQGLGRISESQASEMRLAYFQLNSHLIPDYSCLSIVIDKLPLNILHIPLILMLFPGAKFLLSLRHPMDVCLSCFQQNFEMSDEMAHFTNLNDTFNRYSGVMQQFENFRTKLELPLLVVRYEDMVASFDDVVLKVFDFLGHEPSEEYRNFHRQDNRRLVLTPSHLQVTRDVYQSSCERWRNYAGELEEFAPIIEDLVAHYGYSM